MGSPMIWIDRITNTSSTFGNNFVEFETQSLRQFNPAIIQISKSINYRMGERAHKKLLEMGKIDVNSEEYQAQQFEIIRPMSNKINFFSSQHKEVKALKNIVNQCLSEYLSIFKSEYNNNKPGWIHAWALAYRKMFKSAPHIHHYNPMNIAGIYYAAGDFSKENGDLSILPNNASSKTCTTFIPSIGKLILFPANLSHATGPYFGANIRVSIAFDIWFKPIELRKFIRL